MEAAAPIAYFNPHAAPAPPCWHCRFFGALLYGGTAARCTLPCACKVMALPATGCAFWEREPGADDEPGPPTSSGEVGQLKSRRDPPARPPVAWAP